MPKRGAGKIDIAKHDKRMRAEEATAENLVWRSPTEPPFQLAGFAWFEQDRAYRRMPIKPSHPLPEAVDNLANCPAGGQIRFRSDSRRLSIKVTLDGPHTMWHMPASGQCGFDCYLGPVGKMRYQKTAKFPREASSYEAALLGADTSKTRDITLNFPLYQSVEEILVGLDKDARILPPRPYDDPGRVYFYGTSILQGGCASRPGICYTNILSRRFNREFINLGFSGNGRGQPDVARVIAAAPRPVCFVLDYEWNCQGIATLKQTLPEFIAILREAHPSLPILCVSGTPTPLTLVNAESKREHDARRKFTKEVVEKARRRGDKHIVFQDGYRLMGENWDECAVDGCHPNDLGFMRMADALTPVLKKILGSQQAKTA